jgi:hypothetical protein
MSLVYYYRQKYYQWLYMIYFVFLLQNLLYEIDYMWLIMFNISAVRLIGSLFSDTISTDNIHLIDVMKKFKLGFPFTTPPPQKKNKNNTHLLHYGCNDNNFKTRV